MGEWITGHIITGGEFDGSIIGMTPYAPDYPTYDVWAGYGEGYRNQTGDLFFYNTDFSQQIDVTATIDDSNFTGVLAKVNLYDSDENVVGRFVFDVVSRNGNSSINLKCYIEDPDGVVIGYVPRNTQSQGYTVGLEPQMTGGREFYLALCVLDDGTKRCIGWALNMSAINSGGNPWIWGQRQFRGGFFNQKNIQAMYGIEGDLGPGEKSSPEFGKKAKKKGGYNPSHHRKGTFDDSSDKIEVSSKPGTSPFSTGFIHGYTVNRTQLAGFSQALFPEPPSSFADVPSAIMGLATTILNNKKPDYILDFLIVPVVPSTGTEERISLGGSYLQYADDQGVIHFVYGDPIDINSCYVDHNCGSITIPEYWANFLDFSGSRFKLFLPYVGYVDIQPEYINGGNLKVWYRFNVFDGSFMCYVESTSGHSELDESLIAQYAGVAAVHIPVQARDYSNKISGLISAMGVVAAGATGGISAAGGIGAAANLGNTMVQKPGSTHANGYNASSSFLSHRKPYLIIERQSSQFSEKYPEERGLPLFIMTTIGQCHGLTVCDNPHLDTIPATVEEKEMIMKFLTDGIIV